MLNSWAVAKFGGTSMAEETAIRRSAKVVASKKNVQLVVVSATSGTTNQLLELVAATQNEDWSQCQSFIENIRIKHLKIAKAMECREDSSEAIEKLLKELETIARGMFLLKDPSPKAIDRIQSIGERLSSHFMVKALQDLGIGNVEYLDARTIIKTDDQFGKALPNIERIKEKADELLEPKLRQGFVFVTQGFIGSTEEGFTTTLGRGGSDYSAALFGEAILAKDIQIWTDVSGVATTDPRICPKAQPIREISFSEAAELATFGAKVLHPTTLWPAMRKDIPVFVGNSMAPDDQGTWIKESADNKPLVRAMALRKNQSLLTLTTPRMLHTHGFLAKVFAVFSAHQLSVDLITTSEISIALTLDNASLLNKRLIDDLSQFADVKIDKNLSLISVIGNNVQSTAGLSRDVFSEISDINIRMICIGASPHNIGLLVDEADAEQALKRLHAKFLE
jgi:aspartate kinase